MKLIGGNKSICNQMALLAAVAITVAIVALATGQARADGTSTANSSSFSVDNSDIPQPSRYIYHPNAAKGLYKIDSNGVYYYRVKVPEGTRTMSVRLGEYAPTNLVNPKYSNATFDQIYNSQNYPFIIYDYERPFFRKLGRLSWKLGTGLYVAQGHGVFAQTNPEPKGPKEEFTLVALPLSVGLIYSAQFVPRQWIVPYAEGGADLFAMTELRSDSSTGLSGSFAGAPTAHFSFGARIPLGFGVRDFLDLSREYGISVMYLTGEYRDYISLSNKFDFSGNAITAGIAADY